MIDIKDRVNQMIYRSQNAIDQCSFCLSLLKEQSNSSSFYEENQHTLYKIFNINLRMIIIDLYTLIKDTEKMSIYKVINILRQDKKVSSSIAYYSELINYIEDFEKDFVEFSDIIKDINDFRNRLIAHTDAYDKRQEFYTREISLYRLTDLAYFLNVFSINLSVFVLNEKNIQLIDKSFKNIGINNTFEKISKRYN